MPSEWRAQSFDAAPVIAGMCFYSMAMATLMSVLAIDGPATAEMGGITIVVLAIIICRIFSTSLTLLAIPAVTRAVGG